MAELWPASHRGPSLRGADSRVSLGVDEGGFVEVDGRWLIGSKKPFVPRIPEPANEVPKALVVGADGRLAVVADAQRLQVRGDERAEAARVAVRLDEQPPAISPSADDLLPCAQISPVNLPCCSTCLLRISGTPRPLIS